MAKWATATKNGVADLLASYFNGGYLRIYTGTAPTSADDPATGTLLVEIPLPNPAFGTASGGTVSKTGTWQANATATGTASYYRLASSNGTHIAQGPVVMGTGSDPNILYIQNTSIATGQQVTVTSFSISVVDS